jgi:hypothetical protein
MTRSVPVTISIPMDLLDRVDGLAGTGKRSEFVCRALEEKLGAAVQDQPQVRSEGFDSPGGRPASPRASKNIPVSETWRR